MKRLEFPIVAGSPPQETAGENALAAMGEHDAGAAIILADLARYGGGRVRRHLRRLTGTLSAAAPAAVSGKLARQRAGRRRARAVRPA